MQHIEGRCADYFAWHCKPDATLISQGTAPDGEEFFAMALFFAANRWGDGPEPYNYSGQARAILSACLHQDENGGDPMWDPETKLIKFIPESPFSDPSYHLPHFYDLFALLADERKLPDLLIAMTGGSARKHEKAGQLRVVLPLIIRS